MTKVILADNQAIFRAGTAKILAMEDDFRIIAQCPDGDRLHNAVEAFRGVVLMFAATLKVEAASLLERVQHAGSRAIVVVENQEPAQPHITAGVHGLLYRNVSGPTLLDCVRRVSAGEIYHQPSPSSISQIDEDVVGARVRDRLTPKELKIVALIVQGCKNKEIAIRLGTTEQVIKNYLRSVYDKTGVSDRLELALFTIHHKILAEAAEQVGNLMMQMA